MRVSPKMAIRLFYKILSTGGIREHYNECSLYSEGPAVEQTLISSSTEVEERRWVPDTVMISTETIARSEPTRSLVAPATSVLPAFTLATPSAHRAPAALSCSPSDNPIPPVEVISRWPDLSVVSETSKVNKSRSPSIETDRKRSYSGAEGGQLTRAATYIRERLNNCSSTFDESPRHSSPRESPDKPLEIALLA